MNTTQKKYNGAKISMAVREALINALEHGNGNVAEKPIDIDLEIFDNTMLVTGYLAAY